MFGLALFVAGIIGGAAAGEGMWPPDRLAPVLERLSAEGVELPPGLASDWQAGPLGALARINGCTAAFVSREGLLVTAAHCIRDGLRYASGEHGDLVEQGWLAATPDDELWAGPGTRLTVPARSEDVTDRVHAALRRRMTDAERHRAIERARAAIAAECEAEDPDRRCAVVAFDGGRSYRLVVERVIHDVRIVYAPPEEVVFFGGDRDNWAWPRHAADIALLRAWVGPDGRAARHASDNVPFRPEVWLRPSTADLHEGDVVFQGGYPARTHRRALAVELEHAVNVELPRELSMTRALLQALRVHAAASPAAALRLSNDIFLLSNREKYLRGVLVGLSRTDAVAARRAAEERLVAADREAARVHAELERLAAAHLDAWERDRLLDLTEETPLLLAAARRAYRLALERDKPDAERAPGFHERDVPDIHAWLVGLDQRLYLPAERQVARLVIGWLAALPARQVGASFEGWVSACGGVEAAVGRLFESTPRLASAEERADMLHWTPAEFEASSDPWVRLAVALERWEDEVRDERDAWPGALSRLWPAWIEAVERADPVGTYPDANGTIRISIGRVAGGVPAEGLRYTPFTTLAGLRAKLGGEDYTWPAELVAALDAPTRFASTGLGAVPVDFLTDLDNTAGNAGAPTIDARGRLVGIAFDGTFESLGSDWRYDPELSRSIHVDVRMLLWLLERDEHGAWLLEEMLAP